MPASPYRAKPGQAVACLARPNLARSKPYHLIRSRVPVGYAYIGHQVLLYQQYVDVDTGRMLTAEPADPPNTYNMASVDGNLPVPPADGKWGDEQKLVALPAPSVVITPPLPAPAPAPAPAPDGGDSA